MRIKFLSFKNEDKASQHLNKTKVATIFPSLNFWKRTAFFFFSLRLIVPFFIFSQPLIVFLILILLDWVDYVFYMAARIGGKRYQQIDKSLDLYSYLFMTLYGLTTSYGVIFVFLFFYRLIGTLFFLATEKHLFLLVFPNFIEIMFLAYILSLYFGFETFKIFRVLVIFKMIQEVYLHLINPHLPSIIIEIKKGRRLTQFKIT